MIKIQVPNIPQLQTDYFTAFEQLVIDELKILRISLDHVQGNKLFTDPDFTSFKTTTRDVVNIMRRPELPLKYFCKDDYIVNVPVWKTGATTVHPIKLDQLTNLVDSLIDPTTGDLKSLLICLPEDLMKNSKTLLNKFKVGNKQELAIIKVAFDYTKDIGKTIREFFYKRKLVIHCPYCNQRLAVDTNNLVTGQKADQYQLDHFFDKAKNPLLAFSLFNLVPSDSTCNTTDKGSIAFSDDFHLNPYTSGFKRAMVFQPVYDEFDLEVTDINLKITADRKSRIHMQLIGDKDHIGEEPKHGNINAFQLMAKYGRDREDVLERATRIMQAMRSTAINRQSLQDILSDVGLKDSYENFKRWYEKTIFTGFHEKEFTRHAYSKLHRDILDFVYSQYPHDFNQEVRDILIESYLPARGGE